jgi:hypothetical protein
MKHYIIYRITNLENGKVYIGAHSTINIDDDYLGSGTALHQALRKYGRESFKKEILERLNNEEDMYRRERELVTAEFVARKDTYNMIMGGHVKPPRMLGMSTAGSIWINDGKKHRRIKPTDSIPEGWTVGRLVRPAAGTKWITNGDKTKRIPKEDLIPEGWWEQCTQKKVKKAWHTNGTDDLFIPVDDPVPAGYHRGRTNIADQTSPEYRQRKRDLAKQAWSRKRSK